MSASGTMKLNYRMPLNDYDKLTVENITENKHICFCFRIYYSSLLADRKILQAPNDCFLSKSQQLDDAKCFARFNFSKINIPLIRICLEEVNAFKRWLTFKKHFQI